MSYQVLALKWRPKKFKDVIGQKHITQSLKNSILKKKLGHAYIFSGTRGVGKTTIARIFAKAVRCESLDVDGNPCDICPSCIEVSSESSMNVIEIDGASNNSVENVRDLIGNIHYLPTRGNYKVYIIDEVHMLSVSAFNALLKTLEEPPRHVIFLMATTEPEKLLGTVLSRCQRFDCRNIALGELERHVGYIAEQEKIVFESQSLLKQICIQGRGSVRDTLSLLDQVLSFSEDNIIDEEAVVLSLGLARLSFVKKLVSCVLEGNIQELSSFYQKTLLENVSVKNIMTAILDFLYELIRNPGKLNELVQESFLPEAIKESLSLDEIIWIFESLSKDTTWILETYEPEKVFEIALQKICLRRTFFNKVSSQSKNPAVSSTSPLKEESVQKVNREKKKPSSSVMTQPASSIKPKDWVSFFSFLEESSPATASNLEQGSIVEEMKLFDKSLNVQYGFKESAKVFWEHLNENETKTRLEGLISKFFDIPLQGVDIKLNLLTKEQGLKKEFLSVAEKNQKRDELLSEQNKKELKSHPMIQEAEKLFNSKIDKVILN